MARPSLFAAAVFAAALISPSAVTACPAGGVEKRTAVTAAPAPPSAATRLAPGTQVTYNYRLRTVTMETVPASGEWQWKSSWVDNGTWQWRSDIRDEGYWVDSGYWVGGWITWTTRDWFDTSHWAYAIHNNVYRGVASPVWCFSHSHHPTEGDCGGHGRGFQYHYNSYPYLHQDGYWGPEYVAGYYEPKHTYVNQRYWQSVMVDRGSWQWQSNLVDAGSWEWVETSLPRLEPVISWKTVTASPTAPPVDAVDVTYNYVTLDRACALPT